MQKKIYFQNKPLFLVNELTADIEEYLHHEETVFIDEFNSHTVKAMLHEMEQPKIVRGVFLHSDVEILFNSFRRKFTEVKAAGGFVHTPHNEVLLIFRRGKWDLPKGKLDVKETLENCAIREVKEETGIDHIKIEKPLLITYHTYHEFGNHILKETHWFQMKTKKQPFIPQLNEDIQKCEWVKVDSLAPYLESTHTSLLDVIAEGLKALHETKNV